MQRVSAPRLEICETCGGPLKKLPSAPAFQFKGTGWYVTDYAQKDKRMRESSGKTGEAGAGESSGAAKKESTKSDSAAPTGDGKGKAATSTTGSTGC